jgi:hypothetical protein
MRRIVGAVVDCEADGVGDTVKAAAASAITSVARTVLKLMLGERQIVGKFHALKGLIDLRFRRKT